MKPAIAIGFVLAALLGTALWFLLRNDQRDNALKARELAARRLGEYLARAYPGQRALVVSNPFTENKATAREIVAMENAGIAGLRKGFAAQVTLERIAFPELKAEARTDPRAVFIDAETTTPLSYLVAVDSFDKLVAQHPNCELLVSLVGLPAALKEVQCWRDEKPRFALLLPDLRFIGAAADVKQALDRGKIAALILNRPGAPDLRAALAKEVEFDRRFILVTRDNIDNVMAEYPQLFPM